MRGQEYYHPSLLVSVRYGMRNNQERIYIISSIIMFSVTILRMLDIEGGCIFNFQEMRKNDDPKGLSMLTVLGSIEHEVPLLDINIPGAS